MVQLIHTHSSEWSANIAIKLKKNVFWFQLIRRNNEKVLKNLIDCIKRLKFERIITKA